MPVDPSEIRALLLNLGVALVMSGDAVSLIRGRLGAIAAVHGYDRARVSVLPSLLIVALDDAEPAGVRTIDSERRLRLEQAAEVIAIARRCEAGEVTPAQAQLLISAALAARPRFGTAAYVFSHGVATLGIALVLDPAAGDLWVYVVLGAFVGALKAWGRRFASTGLLLAFLAAILVSAIAFVAHDHNVAESLRLTIPPLVTFLPGALLTVGMVDLALGESITGASRFVAGLFQLAVLAIGIIVGAELVGDPQAGSVADSAAETIGAWGPWVGVAVFAAGIYVHYDAPRGSLGWLLVVLFSAFIGQRAGTYILDATLSGFVGAAIMVPIAHLVARVPSAPPAQVTILPAFWLLVPGALGLVGITEIVGDIPELGLDNFLGALASIPAIALGILVGTMLVRATALDQRRSQSRGGQ